MKCRKCGTILGNDSLFCPNCGTKAEDPTVTNKKKCLKCGSVLRDGARFCANCGAKVEEPPKQNYVKCQNCGTSFEDDSAFCPNCGLKVGNQIKQNNQKCQKCGTMLESDSAFCPNCGTKTGEQPQVNNVVVQPVAPKKPVGPDKLLKTLEISEGKFIKFYQNHMEYHGGTVFYKNIAQVTTQAYASRKTGVLLTDKSFRGEMKILMKNGEKHKIVVKGATVMGIGRSKRKSIEALYDEMVTANSEIMSKGIAEPMLEAINAGVEVKLLNMRIHKDKFYIKKLLKSEEQVVTKEQFGTAEVQSTSLYVTNNSVYILDKNGNKISKILPNTPNVYVVPHVLNALYKS